MSILVPKKEQKLHSGGSLGFLGFCFIVAASMVSCDLSNLIGGNDDDTTTTETTILKSFSVTADENSCLTDDYTAIIKDTDIYISLPYSVISSAVELTPTVELADGYSVTTTVPSKFYDGKIFVIKSTSGVIYNYTVVLSYSTDSVVTSSKSKIQSFEVLADDNSSYLSEDYTAVINDDDIYITLPYTVVKTEVDLTPTVTLLDGYTISPSANYWIYDGRTLVVTDTSSAATYTFTLHVSIEVSSLAFIKLYNPFYYNTSGDKVDLTDYVTVTQDALAGTAILQINTDTLTTYPRASVAEGILSRPIGFSTVTVPSSGTSNVANAIAGSTCPYSISFTSNDGSITQNYSVSVERTLSSSTIPVSIKASYYPVYKAISTKTITTDPITSTAYSNSTYDITFTNKEMYFTLTTTKTGAGGYESTGYKLITAAQNYATYLSYYNALDDTTTSYIYDSNNSCSETITFSSDSNTISISPVTGIFYSKTSVTSSSTNSLVVAATYSLYINYSYGTYSYKSTGTCSSTLDFVVSNATAYTQQAYNCIHKICVNFSSDVTIKSVTIYSSLTDSYSESESEGIKTITFNCLPTTTKQSGNVGTIEVEAEDGTISTKIITIS